MSIPSPCIKICRLDENKTCIGCGRTIEEIANWTTYNDETKIKIIHRAMEKIKKTLKIHLTL
jgi:uncharacterized protein